MKANRNFIPNLIELCLQDRTHPCTSMHASAIVSCHRVIATSINTESSHAEVGAMKRVLRRKKAFRPLRYPCRQNW